MNDRYYSVEIIYFPLLLRGSQGGVRTGGGNKPLKFT